MERHRGRRNTRVGLRNGGSDDTRPFRDPPPYVPTSPDGSHGPSPDAKPNTIKPITRHPVSKPPSVGNHGSQAELVQASRERSIRRYPE
jgi:hypothetical protein